MKTITAENIKFSYDGKNKILDGISFETYEGEYIGITGDSGCGKSTLCRILCGIAPYNTGGIVSGNITLRKNDEQINLKDVKLSQLAEITGYVMQDSDCQIVSSTVEDELAFGPENLCISPEKIRKRIDETAELLGINDLLMSNPNTLSGGQKQMVAIGSILTLDPKIIILDEPFSHLDEKSRLKLNDVIRKLIFDNKTVIVVEHDHSAIENADRKLCIKNGKIEREYT